MAANKRDKIITWNGHAKTPDIAEIIHRARAEKNWEKLLETGKLLLDNQRFSEATTCFIEARHLNKDDPITHKHLGDAYWAEAQHHKEQDDHQAELKEKAHKCYTEAMAVAEATNDEHFLAEFRQELAKKL